VGLDQLVRFLVVKFTQFQILDLIWVLYLRLIILSVGGDVPVNSETFLVTDFINLKIKSAQSFEVDYRDRVCVHVLIEVSTHTCMNICVCTVFLTKIFYHFSSCIHFLFFRRLDGYNRIL
jgi:hypothetical protein